MVDIRWVFDDQELWYGPFESEDKANQWAEKMGLRYWDLIPLDNQLFTDVLQRQRHI